MQSVDLDHLFQYKSGTNLPGIMLLVMSFLVNQWFGECQIKSQNILLRQNKNKHVLAVA